MTLAIGVALSACASVALLWRSLTASKEACSVAELLSTRLSESKRTGLNERLGFTAHGYQSWLLRDPNASEAFTQRDRLRGVERSLLCAERLFNDTPWWLIGGAVVGLLRHGALLPHDTDADIQFDKADFINLAFALRRQRRMLPPPHYSDEDKRTWRRVAPRKVLFSDGQCAILFNRNISTVSDDEGPVGHLVDVGSGFLSDLWVGNGNATTFRWHEYGEWHEMPIADLFPLERRQLGLLSFQVPVPRSPQALLSRSFGGDFRHPTNLRMVLALFTRLPSRHSAQLLVLASAAAVADAVPWWASATNVVAAVQLLGWSSCAGEFAPTALCFAAALALQLRRCRQWRVVPLALLALLCCAALRAAVVCLLFRQTDWVDYRSFWDGTALASRSEG